MAACFLLPLISSSRKSLSTASLSRIYLFLVFISSYFILLMILRSDVLQLRVYRKSETGFGIPHSNSICSLQQVWIQEHLKPTGITRDRGMATDFSPPPMSSLPRDQHISISQASELVAIHLSPYFKNANGLSFILSWHRHQRRITR